MRKTIDIHGMTCHEAQIEVTQQLFSIRDSGFISELIIIFGKGTGTLRQCVVETLQEEGYSFTTINDGALKVHV